MADNENLTVEESVAKAAAEAEPETELETPEQEPEEEQEEAPKQSAEEREALELLRALKDPSRSSAVIEHLARQAGLLRDGEKPTKAEEKEIKRSFKDVAKKHLGEDFQVLSEKLGEILEEVLAEKDKEFESKLHEIERRRAEQSFMAEFNQFLTEKAVTDEEAGKMMELMDEIAPGKTASMQKYLDRLLSLTRGSQADKVKSEIAEKRKATNKSREVESMGVDGKYETQKVKGPISPLEAVLAASRGIKLEG